MPLTIPTPTIDFPPRLATIESWLSLFVCPGDVAELIAFDTIHDDKPCKTACGFFDYPHLKSMAREAVRKSGQSKGVYITLNPLVPACLDRRKNCLGMKSRGVAACDLDVRERRWIFLDIDPVRASGESSTDSEKLLAWNRAVQVREWLEKHWGQPDVVGDSGNGYHLLYKFSEPIILPSTEPDPTHQLLLALSDLFTDSTVAIDVKVSNPGRIIKCPGTQTKKGKATKVRPHRWSWIVEVNGETDG